MLDFLSKLFILLVGIGAGFFLACIGAARIVAEKKDLKDELAQVKAERDYLADIARQNTKTIEINDKRVTQHVANTTGDYFKPF